MAVDGDGWRWMAMDDDGGLASKRYRTGLPAMRTDGSMGWISVPLGTDRIDGWRGR